MPESVTIAGHHLAPYSRTFVIAEIGSNHDGKLEIAKKMIEQAKEVGADAAKFQVFNADTLYPRGTPTHAAVRQCELPRSWIPTLAEHSQRCGVVFLASPFDTDAVDRLEAVGMSAYKIASSETTNLPLLSYIAAKKKPILLSTGMCDLGDIHEAVQVIRAQENDAIVLLQCAAVYPSEPRQIHLRAMETLAGAFHCPVGFSDHSLDIFIPVAAVARGAVVLEKHLTLDRRLAGPDHSYALEPGPFGTMVRAIRDVEAALGSAEKTMLPEEAQYARRESIHAARDLKAGDVLSETAVVLQRPGTGIRPRYLPAILGRPLRRSVQKGQAVTWDLVGESRS